MDNYARLYHYKGLREDVRSMEGGPFGVGHSTAWSSIELERKI
jgi:hypothetical protein